jgi:hypothetical protein
MEVIGFVVAEGSMVFTVIPMLLVIAYGEPPILTALAVSQSIAPAFGIALSMALITISVGWIILVISNPIWGRIQNKISGVKQDK